jgi:hypothetical protein
MYKVDGEVWIEVHPPIDAQGQAASIDLKEFERRLNDLLGFAEVAINWELALETLARADGIPTVVGLELLPETDYVETAAPDV